MSTEKHDTITKIMQAATVIIGKEGNLNATIRDISQRAEVNIASINYYFRSKDKLMEEVESKILEDMRRTYQFLRDENKNPRERLLLWADGLMQYLMDYPGIIYMLGTKVLIGSRQGASLAEYMKRSTADLTPVVSQLTGVTDERLLEFKVLHLTSGVVYPILIYSSNETKNEPSLKDSRNRKEYLSLLIDSI